MQLEEICSFVLLLGKLFISVLMLVTYIYIYIWVLRNKEIVTHSSFFLVFIKDCQKRNRKKKKKIKHSNVKLQPFQFSYLYAIGLHSPECSYLKIIKSYGRGLAHRVQCLLSIKNLE